MRPSLNTAVARTRRADRIGWFSRHDRQIASVALCRANCTQARQLPYVDEPLADIHPLFMAGHGGDQPTALIRQARTRLATRVKIAA